MPAGPRSHLAQTHARCTHHVLERDPHVCRRSLWRSHLTHTLILHASTTPDGCQRAPRAAALALAYLAPPHARTWPLCDEDASRYIVVYVTHCIVFSIANLSSQRVNFVAVNVLMAAFSHFAMAESVYRQRPVEG